jgi:ABC-type dipeptide/oligopeptide/nickel transport system permease component
MIAYFARRIVGGVVTLFVATLALFSLITYGLGGLYDLLHQPCQDCRGDNIRMYDEFGAFLHIDQPWPVSYLAWLFDPNGPKHLPWSQGANVAEEGQAVTYLPGEWLGQSLRVLVLTLFLSMMVIAVQRRKRPPVPALPTYPQSGRLLHYYAHPMRVPGL